ncbi:cullin-1-like [Sitodiplosis mosellana]|uniref:cullin-1-like n=1 Tax=Sitodiplosis mosellana TaxID=263140 RepID=UPI0024441332|nr:cullin-1-like [Sitodiplosis mosellana]
MAANSNSQYVNLDRIWTILKGGITQIYKQELTTQQYMDLWSLVYNYCTTEQKNSKKYFNLSSGRVKVGRSEIIGGELYERLENFLANYLTDLLKSGSNLNNEEFWTFYTTKWVEYRFLSRVLTGVFGYINRTWVRRECEEGNEDVYEVFQLALVTWREHLFKHLNKQVEPYLN